MSQNHESCDCRLIRHPDLISIYEWYRYEDLLEKSGDFFWAHDRGITAAIILRLPGNEGGSIAPIPVIAGHGGSPWIWDRNIEKPTLAPSIWRNRGLRNDWHGHLVAGVLKSQ